jgi:PIN domain nuclease of toxin-antitoxin system
MPERSDGLLLLDTHIWIWLADSPERVSPACVDLVRRVQPSGRVCLSPISVWEVGMLERKGRVSLSLDVRAWVTRTLATHLRVAPLTPEIALDAALLPGVPVGDPADRLLMATARVLGATLVTRDAAVLGYGAAGHVRVMDAGA